MTRKKDNRGWHGESVRHSKAAKGVKTGNKKTTYYPIVNKECHEDDPYDVVNNELSAQEIVDKHNDLQYYKSEDQARVLHDIQDENGGSTEILAESADEAMQVFFKEHEDYLEDIEVTDISNNGRNSNIWTINYDT